MKRAIAFLSTLILSNLSAAQDNFFSSEQARIMTLEFSDGKKLSDAFEIYPFQNKWFFPIKEFTESIGLQVAVTSELGLAEGYILRESNQFALDAKKCTAKFSGRNENFDCTRTVIYEQDLYVDQGLLELWFPLKIEIDLLGSRVILHTREPFPAQSRHSQDAILSKKEISGEYDPGYPRKDIPREWLDGLFLDQQLAYSNRKTQISNTASFEHDTFASGEFLGFETQAHYGRTQDNPERKYFTLARRDPDGQMFGSLGVKEIELHDTTLPALPLVGGGSAGRGLRISSFPLTYPNTFSFHTIEGVILPGWEVELYQNDILIDRTTENSGRFKFENISLLYGVNRFKLVFYGPQGQRHEETEVYNVDASVLSPGRRQFRTGFLLPNQTLLTDEQRYFFELDQSVFKSLTIKGGVSHLVPRGKTEYRDYGVLGAYGFLRGLFLSATYANDQNNGSATEIGTRFPLGISTIALSHASLRNFESDLFTPMNGFAIKQQNKASLSLIVPTTPTVRLIFDATERLLENGDRQRSILNRLATYTGPINWFHDLIYDMDPQPSWTGHLTALMNIQRTQLRLETEYNKENTIAYAGDILQRFSPEYSVGGGARYLVAENLNSFHFTFNRIFEVFTLSANYVQSGSHDQTARVLLSYSFNRNPTDNSWHLKGEGQTAYAAISTVVFLDKNRNGILDSGDERLPNIIIKVNQTETKMATDIWGQAFITRVPTYQPVDISVAERSLEDPLYRLAQKGVRVIPRAGKTARIDIPVVVVGEVGGSIRTTIKGKERGVKNAIVSLYDANSGTLIRSVKSESDGFYLFDEVPPGSYRIRIKADQLERKSATVQPAEIRLDVPLEGTISTENNFIITAPEGRL